MSDTSRPAGLPPLPLAVTALAFLLAVVFGVRSAGAEESETDLLERIGVESVEKTYRGQKMVIDFSRSTPRVSKLTIIHHLGGRERREYHSSQSVVVIDGDYFYQYHPAKKIVVKRKLPGEGGYEAIRRENLKQTLESYRFKTEPSEAIAGRQTRLFEFSPLQERSRPRRKVWVDTETGLVLRTEIYGSDDTLFWMSVFEDIDYRPQVAPASFTMPIPAGVRIVESQEGRCLAPAKAEEVAQFPVGLPDYLPLGFVRKCIRARKSKDYGEIQVLYSDGLSLLSLFESSRFRARDKGGREGARTLKVGREPAELNRLGLVSALSWQSSWAHLTLLGEISQDELVKVAESISPARELSRP